MHGVTFLEDLIKYLQRNKKVSIHLMKKKNDLKYMFII